MKANSPKRNRLPFYYRFAKYISVVFVIGIMILALAWTHPGESITATTGRFSWLLIIMGVFFYLHFLVVEDEANKLFQAKRKLEEQEAGHRSLLKISNRITTARDLRQISRLGLIGLIGLTPLRKGFLAVARDNGELEVTATWHISRDRAQENARRLAKHAFSLHAGDKEQNPGPDSEWKHLLVVPLPGKNGRPAGFLAADPVANRLTDLEQNMTVLLARGVGPAIQNEILRLQLEYLSIVDSLTDLYNHRYYCEQAAGEISRAKRFGQPVAVMISDIDNFKNHVDTHGHLTADKTLRKLSLLIKGCLRQSDLIGRWGGDEFAYLLPQTGKAGALAVALKIQRTLSEKCFTEEGNGALTLSFGIASFPEDGGEWFSLLKKADKALFRAKSLGKNRACVEGEG